MKKIILLLTIAAMLGCKKDKTPEPFVAETELTTFEENLKSQTNARDIRGMELHAASQTLYFYEIPAVGTGYHINAYHIPTKSLSTVFRHLTATWSNGNGSEGARIRIWQDKLYVSGGANNNQIHILQGLGSNSLSLEHSQNVTAPYDFAFQGNTVYLGTFSQNIVAFSVNQPNMQHNYPFAVGESRLSHGSSILAVHVNDQPHLVVTKTDYIELRTHNNLFVKSVATPQNTASLLQKDDQGRVYVLGKDKILRYAPDLTGREEFPCTGIDGQHSSWVFVIQPQNDHYIIYYKAYEKLKTVRIPK